MKTYLVTGGAGFIGSNYIHYMLKKYGSAIHIVNLDSLTYAGNLENLKEIEALPNYEFVKLDVCDKDGILALFKKYNFDRVIHFAAESHVDRSIKNPEIFANTNILGTLNLLNAAKQTWETEDGFLPDKRYLQVSTDEVYGSLDDADVAAGKASYFYETTPLDPHSPYSASKASADMLVKAYMDTYHFPANITRCSNNYGPYQFPEKLIPLMINNALQGKALPVYGDGKNVRDWLYVADHAKAIDMVCEKGQLFGIYNVGGHNEKQNIEIVKLTIQTIRRLMTEQPEYREVLKKKEIGPDGQIAIDWINEDLITFVKDRLGHDQRYAIDPTKITRELGWTPETSFEVGIVKTIRWYLENQQWVEEITGGDYMKYYEQMYGNR